MDSNYIDRPKEHLRGKEMGGNSKLIVAAVYKEAMNNNHHNRGMEMQMGYI